MANTTKKALEVSLKKLLKEKPFDKITIADLTGDCGISRMTFYYHFQDVYDLLRWMFQEEAVDLLKRHEGALLWQEGLLQLFHYIEENKAVCLCTLNSVGRDHLRRFFEDDVYAIIHRAVEQVGAEIGVLDTKQADIDLITHFYVAALAGILESWLLGIIDRTPEELISSADQILQDHMRGAQERLKEQRNN